jgi:hypothetical protein
MPYKDPKKQKEAMRQWYQNVVRKRREDWFKENGPCVDCGIWEGLELDHLDRTTKVDHKVWSWSKPRRIKELAKCVVRCEKCHGKHTAEQCRELFCRPITHGIVSAYLQRGCRCDICREFYKKWRRDKYERIGK